MKKAEAAEILEDAQELLERWERFKLFMDKGIMTEEEITREDEQLFLDDKSAISRLSRSLSQRLPSDLAFGASKMGDLMKGAISIQNFRAVPDTEVPQMQSTWHMVWVYITRTVGGLQFLAEGGKPAQKKALPSKIKRGRKQKKKPILKVLLILAVLVIAGGAVAVYFNII